MKRKGLGGGLTALVLGHFAITIAHGAAHGGAGVALGPAGIAFVIAVIEVAPLAGLALAWFRPQTGAWLIAASMAGAFLFGFINHFIIVSPDHVSQVAPAYRLSFGTTAVLLAVTEAAAAFVGLRAATRTVEVWS